MNESELRDFCRQLAIWAESALDQGRYPFRKVEQWLPLLTPAGKEPAPLVLWINRDSFMAGGVLFFPPRDCSAAIAAGARCAEALGLAHFTLWTRQRLEFWELASDTPRLQRSVAAPHGPGITPEDFRDTLETVLQEIKVQSVLAPVPPGRLSPFYFANLCQAALHDTLPALTVAARLSGPRRTTAGIASAEARAMAKGFLTILRLLTLVAFDLLPPSVPPEGLERAGRFALQTLPLPLATTLAADDEIPLGPAETVRFHHLFRRLGQVQLGSDPARTRRIIELLLQLHARALGGHPLPPCSDLDGTDLLLNPEVPQANGKSTQEVAPRPLLAAFSLHRALSPAGANPLQAVTPMALDNSRTPHGVLGTLTGAAPLLPQERSEFVAHLRLSWPTRRWQLPSDTPRWGWEVLHLLGLAAPTARFDLFVPSNWLDSEFAAWFCTFLACESDWQRLEVDGHFFRIQLVKQPPETTGLAVSGLFGTRNIAAELLQHQLQFRIRHALHLPADFYRLLETKLLQLPDDTLDATGRRGAALFACSSIGRELQKALGIPLPAAGSPAIAPDGLPLPKATVLCALADAFPVDVPMPEERALHFELARLFPEISQLATVSILESGTAHQRRSRHNGQASTLELVDILAGEVFREGLPVFPEQYLYAYYRPELAEFTFTPPLTLGDTFFDQITLLCGDGGTLTVEGRETAEALLLLAATGATSANLPLDRGIMTEILTRYRTDLLRLLENLRQHAYHLAADAAGAERLIARTWASRRLPPWALLTP